jgi:hypothetical protein
MEKEHIQRLLSRLSIGQATEQEKREIEAYLEAGLISLEDIEDLSRLDAQIMKMDAPTPSSALDDRFYRLLSAEKAKNQPINWMRFFSWPEFAPKLAIASVTLLLGMFAGYVLRSSTVSPKDHMIEALSEQVSDLQEMMMLSLLEKGSATDRLKAVNLTQEMTEASRKVTSALIRTLNEDENVNVRLAALEALKPYARDSIVREALVRSIGQQESPLVQISLAELMVALQEKSAVNEFEKIVESDNTPPEVKRKIRESIDVLI